MLYALPLLESRNADTVAAAGLDMAVVWYSRKWKRERRRRKKGRRHSGVGGGRGVWLGVAGWGRER